MPQPIWVTPAGNFGTYTEGVPITQTFTANTSYPGWTLVYTILNGTFPDATVPFSINPSTGVFTGTAAQVDATMQFSFTIRVTQYDGPDPEGSTDRTFSFTVEGVTPPSFITSSGPLYPGPTYLPDSTWNPYQILVNNPDPNTTPTIRLVNGSLPPGLEINTAGLIRGYADPTNSNFPFTLEVESESGTAIRDFSIQIVQQTSMTRAPAILNTRPPSYNIPITDPRQPYYTNSSGNLGILSQNNYFIFRILGESFSSGSISYSRTGTLPPGLSDNINYNSNNVLITITSAGVGYSPGDQLRILGGSLGGVTGTNDLNFVVTTTSAGNITGVGSPSGLNVDSNTSYTGLAVQTVTGGGSGAVASVSKINAGWILGTITNNPALTVDTYTFTYTALNNNNGLTSTPTSFTATVVSQENNIPFDIGVEWETGENLGTIYNGAVSMLAVEAINLGGLDLEYTLTSGTLPPDLTLNLDGTITGFVAWETQGSLTPIDTSIPYTFTVTAQNPLWPEITSNKTFTVTVYQKFDQPYDNIYIRSLFDIGDRAILDSLLQDEYLIPQAWLFRPLDPNFGKATDVVYQHMYGVPSSDVATYVTAVERNHYRRSLVLGPLKTARATDSAGNIIYEVVYSEIVDNLVNNEGVSISKQITWPVPINGVRRRLYPNSLPNMRQQIRDFIGQNTTTDLLPRWMASQQADGGILGFIPAWVVCYTKPGYSEIIKNNIINQYTAPITVSSTLALDSTLEISSTAGFYPGMRVEFSGTGFGGITIGMRYYVYSILSDKHFTVTTSMFTGPVQLTTATGSMSVAQVPWDYTLNILNYKIDRFEVGKSLTFDYNPNTGLWATLPSGVDPTDSQDEYIYFQKNILGNT